MQYLKREESCSNYTPFSFEVRHQQFCIDRFCSCQQLKLLCPNGSHCTDPLMYTYARSYFQGGKSFGKQQSAYADRGEKLSHPSSSCFPLAKITQDDSHRIFTTWNTKRIFVFLAICLCQEDRQIRIYKNILHSIITIICMYSLLNVKVEKCY